MTQPRLIPTADAVAYLGGRHPSEFGLQPIGNGRGQRWDIRAINAYLDRKANLVPGVAQGPANDDDPDELAALREKFGASEGV